MVEYGLALAGSSGGSGGFANSNFGHWAHTFANTPIALTVAGGVVVLLLLLVAVR